MPDEANVSAVQPSDPPLGASHVTVEHRFAMIPEALLYNSELPADAVRVYGVLLRHGSDPTNCYPSHRRIAGLIGKSAASVPGWIKQLESAGWLRRVIRHRADGSPDSNGYHLFAAPQITDSPAGERALPVPEQGPLPAGERGPSPLGNGPKESKVNESNENEKTNGVPAGQLALVDLPSSPAARRDNPLTLVGFDAFWRIYPRKVGKPSARRAWEKAIHRANAADIIAGVQRYADDPNREDKYTKHPAPWLNDDRWNDPPLAPRRSKDRMATGLDLLGQVGGGARMVAALGSGAELLAGHRGRGSGS